MEVENQNCEIYIMQNNTRIVFPDYNYIIIDNVKYPLVGDIEFLKIFSHYPIKGIVSGIIKNQTGSMPNPTIAQNVFEITNFVKTNIQ